MATTSKPETLPTIDRCSPGAGVLSTAPSDTDIVMTGDALSFPLRLSVTGQVTVVADARPEPAEVYRHRTHRPLSLWPSGVVCSSSLFGLGEAIASRNPLDSLGAAS
jgi:hypothetical protein